MKKNFGKAIYTLEFDKIREMLAEVAPTEGAAARALTLEPDTDIDRIRLELKKTTAAKKTTAKTAAAKKTTTRKTAKKAEE